MHVRAVTLVLAKTGESLVDLASAVDGKDERQSAGNLSDAVYHVKLIVTAVSDLLHTYEVVLQSADKNRVAQYVRFCIEEYQRRLDLEVRAIDLEIERTQLFQRPGISNAAIRLRDEVRAAKQIIADARPR